MQAVLVVMLFIAVVAGMETRFRNSAETEVQRAAGLALQLVTYHSAAVKMCQAITCPNGVLDPRSYLGGMAVGQSVYSSGQFKSAYDGASMVVTTYVPRAGYDPIRLFGPVADSLRKMIPGAVNAGPWNASAQAITIAPQLGASASGTITGAYTYSVPATVGGLTLTDGAPVIATKIH